MNLLVRTTGTVLLSLCVFYSSYGQLSLDLQVTNSVCGYGNGVIYAKVTGGSAPYSFSDNGSPAQPNPLFSGLTAGTHAITVVDARGATAGATATVTNMYPPPSITLQGQTAPTDCNVADGSIKLSAGGGTAPYRFSVNNTGPQPSPVFPGLSAGYYSASVSDANGCRQSVKVVLTASSCPAAGATLSFSPVVCAASGFVTATPAAGAALPYSYSLEGTGYPATPYQGSGSFSDLPAGSYYLTIRDKNGHNARYAFQIQQHCGLPATATTRPAHCDTTDGSIEVSVTGGNPPVFYSTDGVTYQESTILTGQAAGAHTVYIIDAFLNTDTLVATVDHQPCPTMTVSSTPSSCMQNNGSITVTDYSGGTAPVEFSLDGVHFQQDRTFTGVGPGHYTVRAKDADSIVTTDSVTVVPLDNLTVFAGDDTSILAGQPFTLHARDLDNGGFNSYRWTPPTGLDNPNSPDPVATINQEQTYTVTATTGSGCSATDAIKVVVLQHADIFVPNAFTPNGNGHNDVLRAWPVGMRDLEYFAVFNRFGQQVFLSHNAGEGWDGRIDGQPQPPGTYVWMVRGTDLNGKPVEHKGTVLLIR